MITERFHNRAARILLVLLCLGAGPLLWARPVDAEALATLDGIQPMNEAELAAATGGFTVDGLNINIGVETETLINGQMVIQSNLSTGSLPVGETLPTLTAQLQTVNGLTQIIQMAGGQNTIINNTASNTTINQLQQMTVDVANFSKINPAATAGLMSLQTQVTNGLRNSLH
jgi:hypothetical protein